MTAQQCPDDLYEALLPSFAAFAKEHIWDDEDWDLFLRTKVVELSTDWTKEDVLYVATHYDFKDEETRKRLTRMAEWEPNIPNDDTVIRRYLRFDRFASMIQNEGLWMSNVTEFSDSFEASYPAPLVDEIQKLADIDLGRGDNQYLHSARNRMKRDNHTYVNCWRTGKEESSVFWDAYITEGRGVAIQTTVGSLRENVGDDVWNGYIEKSLKLGIFESIKELSKLMIGEVEYLNYASDMMSSSNRSPARFFHKRGGFEDEREFRLVKMMFPPGYAASDLPEPKEGLILPTDLERMVDKVILPPFASDSYTSLVDKYSEDYLNAPIQRSALERKPTQVSLD